MKNKIVLSNCLLVSLTILSGCSSQNSNKDVNQNTQTSTKNQLENCVKWFDGCNTCFVEDDRITGCTERYCTPDQYKESKCSEYKK